MTLFVVLMATLTEILVWRNVLSEGVLKCSAKENVHVPTPLVTVNLAALQCKF